LREAHSGECGEHQAGRNLVHRVHRMGYYWPTMFKDAIEYAKRCHEGQIHGDVIHVPPEDLHQSIASWPFSAWGLDVIGPINPPSSKAKQYILAATDYFSKWTEAVALRNVKEKDVVDFIRHAIIYRHGIPKKIVTDNDTPFKNRGMEKLCQKFSIRHSFSTPYYPPANGLAEAFNKTIVKIIKKTVTGNKRDWDEKLQEALWAYRTTCRTSTGATPYSLIYGTEAVIPIEIHMASLRVAVHQSMTDDENARIRLKELDLLDEKLLTSQQRLQSYQARISAAFDKQVKYRSFKKGDMVLMLKRPIVVTHRTGGKFEPK
ncbi:integrase, partial [Mycobacterium kansasii]